MNTRLNSPNDQQELNFLTFILESISELFVFETNGKDKYSPEDISVATLLMCCFYTSTETIQIIDSLPSADRILARKSEEKGLILGKKINQMLKKRVLSVNFPPGVKITVAGDLIENPFYGNKNNPVVMGGKAKADTKYFYNI